MVNKEVFGVSLRSVARGLKTSGIVDPFYMKFLDDVAQVSIIRRLGYSGQFEVYTAKYTYKVNTLLMHAAIRFMSEHDPKSVYPLNTDSAVVPIELKNEFWTYLYLELVDAVWYWDNKCGGKQLAQATASKPSVGTLSRVE